MRRSVFVFATVLLVLAALYALASMWMALSRLDRLDGASAAMLRAEETRTVAQAFLTSTVNIETATRGFVLYADPALLTPFENARVQAPQLLDQLRDHVRDDPTQLSRLDRITQQLAQSISLSEFIIERKRAGTGQTTEMTQFGDRAMATTKSIRLLADEIDMAESERLANARSSWKAELRGARTVEVAMCALTLAVILLAAWVLARLRRLAPLAQGRAETSGSVAEPGAAGGVAVNCGGCGLNRVTGMPATQRAGASERITACSFRSTPVPCEEIPRW